MSLDVLGTSGSRDTLDRRDTMAQDVGRIKAMIAELEAQAEKNRVAVNAANKNTAATKKALLDLYRTLAESSK